MDTKKVKSIDLYFLNIIIDELDILNINIDELNILKTELININNNLFKKIKINNINKKLIPVLNKYINNLEIIRDKIINNKININKYPSYISEIINIINLYIKILNELLNNNYISIKEEILFWKDNIKYNLLVIRSDLDPIEINYIEVINNYENKELNIDVYLELINKLKEDKYLRSRLNNKYLDLVLNKIYYLKELENVKF